MTKCAWPCISSGRRFSVTRTLSRSSAQGAAFDSLALTVSAEATAEHFVPLHMYAVASICILYSHFRAQLFDHQQGQDFFSALTMLTINGTRHVTQQQSARVLAIGVRIAWLLMRALFLRSPSLPPLLPSPRQSCPCSRSFASWRVSTTCATTGQRPASHVQSWSMAFATAY